MWIAELDVYVDCSPEVYASDDDLRAALKAQLERNIASRRVMYEVLELRGPGGGNSYVRFTATDFDPLFDFVVNFWGPEQAFSVKEIK